jgi:hypothetical protein
VEAPSNPGRGLRVRRSAGAHPASAAYARAGTAARGGYRYVKIGSPMSIQLKIDSAFGIGTRRQPWLAG